ncbi:hypothetical protein HAX54_042348 [Datura stramonium]|uniref:Uncharacterized protein n=1 Tax=Datura stramonium TaxID=4076 RepID=A0ABS8SMD1_DATST|nr:hypothetical protein [Datura stramonium]
MLDPSIFEIRPERSHAEVTKPSNSGKFINFVRAKKETKKKKCNDMRLTCALTSLYREFHLKFHSSPIFTLLLPWRCLCLYLPTLDGTVVSKEYRDLPDLASDSGLHPYPRKGSSRPGSGPKNEAYR